MAVELLSPEDTQLFKACRCTHSLARFLRISSGRLKFCLYSPRREPYRTFDLQKKSGGFRQIDSPPPTILILQRRLLRAISTVVPPKRGSHGFHRGRSICTNARIHIGARWVLNVDLKDFFPTIHFGRVVGVYRSHPFNFNREVSHLLAQLCCWEQRLPQGAPTSPAISNLICRGLDRDLLAYARDHRCRYSRYADDISLSGSQPEPPQSLASFDGKATVLCRAFENTVLRHGFFVNSSKTRVQFSSSRLTVTGLVVNRKVNVPRAFVRNLRATLHLASSNPEKAQQRLLKNRTNHRRATDLLTHCRGKVDYLRMVKGAGDPVFCRYSIKVEQVLAARPRLTAVSGCAAADPGLVAEALWILRGTDTDGEIVSEGTAFFLRGYGLVTANHVLECSTAVSWEVHQARAPSKTVRVESVKRDAERDLAILSTDIAPVAELIPSSSTLTGGQITLVGYPRYITGSPPMFTSASISQVRPISGVRYGLTTANIESGASGGPALSPEGMCEGIIVAGKEHDVFPNAYVIVHEMATCAAASPESC